MTSLSTTEARLNTPIEIRKKVKGAKAIYDKILLDLEMHVFCPPNKWSEKQYSTALIRVFDFKWVFLSKPQLFPSVNLIMNADKDATAKRNQLYSVIRFFFFLQNNPKIQGHLIIWI